MNDSEIVGQVLNGDIEAYGLLIKRWSGAMFRLAVSLTGSDTVAADAVEDAFTDCYLHLSSLACPAAFGGWLATAVRRKCWRAHRPDRGYTEISELEEILPDDEITPAANFIRRENDFRIRAAIDSLSPGLRETAKRFYLDDCSVKEIAVWLGLPEGTVRRRLHDAREKLRKELCDMNENRTPPADMEAKIKERIRLLNHYYAIHGGYDEEFVRELGEVVRMIGNLSDDSKKQYYSAETYRLSARNEEKEKADKLMEAGENAARLGGNAELLSDSMVDKALELKGKACITYINETALPALAPYTASPDYQTACGKLIFWRGRTKLENDTQGALADFDEAAGKIAKDNIWHAAAVAARRAVDLSLRNSAFPGNYVSAVCERLYTGGSRLLFAAQLGFSSGNSILPSRFRFDSLLYFLSRVDRLLADSAMKPGDCVQGKNGEFGCVSTDESVSVCAGQFEGCVHYRVKTSVKYTGDYTADYWFRDGVGLVRAVFVDAAGHREDYELDEYHVSGTGLLPLAEGNRWVYINRELPAWLYTRHEYTVCHTDGKFSDLAVCRVIAMNKDYSEVMEKSDSEACIAICDQLCDNWKLEDAVNTLRAAVRANTSAESVQTALCGIDTLTRFADYQRKGYRFCPSSVNSSYIGLSDTGASYDECGYNSFGPYRYGKRGHPENRIFGIKPFRYLQNLCDGIWSNDWKPGYEKTLTLRNNEVVISVSDGGRVETPCGVFDNCRKLTVTAGDCTKNADFYLSFHDGYVNAWLGKKEFWFAPGVGIVRHVCTWGELVSEALLTAYRAPAAAPDEYLPIHIGSAWEYEETHLAAEGYRAVRRMNVASGLGKRYLLTEAQEFIYLGTEEQYEAFRLKK